jgi:hypothetical protein
MKSYTLEFQNESLVDQVMNFFKQLPQNEVFIKENKQPYSVDNDFISYLTSNPAEVSHNDSFLTREDANAR